MSTITDNHFSDVIQDVEGAPNSQKADRLIQGIAKQLQQMQQSNTSPQQLGQELLSVKQQLVKACSQQGG